MTDIRDRMLKFLDKVKTKHPGKNVIAIGHGDPLMILKAHLQGMPMELDSIRPGLKGYVTYGEIYKISLKEKITKFSQVFCPSI